MKASVWMILLMMALISLKAADACDSIQLSFDLCMTDPQCTSSFYIDENGDDFDVFSFLYLRFASPHTTFETLETILCSHDNSSLVYNSSGSLDPVALDDFYVLWIQFMSSYHFCEINAYMDSSMMRCVCKQDKICVYIAPRDMEFHSSNYQVFLWIIIVALLVIYAATSRKIKSVMTVIQTVSGTQA